MSRLTLAEKARRETESAALAFQIAAGLVKVKRCPTFEPPRFRGKSGGAMPAHLNPVTMGDHDDGRA